MSTTALEVVRIATQAYSAGDPEITLQLADPMIGWDERASRHDAEAVVGQRDVLMAMHRYFDSWEEYEFAVEKLAVASDSAIVGVCTEKGISREGVPVDRRFGACWVVQDGKILTWTTYLSPREALLAAREVDPVPRSREPEPLGESVHEEERFTPEQRKAAKRRARLRRFARARDSDREEGPEPTDRG